MASRFLILGGSTAGIVELKKVLRRTLKEVWLNVQSGEPGKAVHALKTLFGNLFFDYPWSVQLEPCNLCNLHCDFCSAPPWELERQKRMLSLENAQKIVDDVSRYTHYLWFWLAGEPFLNPQAGKIIRHATSRGMHVIVSSNCMLLTEKVAEEVVDARLDELIVSADGASKQSSEAMRKGSTFETVVKNIKFLSDLKRRKGVSKPQIIMQLIVSKKNEHEIEAFKQLAREVGADRCEFKSLGLPTWIYDEGVIEKLKQEYFPVQGGVRYTPDFEIIQRSCGWDKKAIIMVDGTVCLCCYDINGKYNFGNVLETPFLDIWRSAQRLSARNLIGEMPLCQVCGASVKTYLGKAQIK
ncbi:MAG TPA: radical SAM protein [Candidatus Diapherotrites archaeon]|uniref:Radical SAM protein n=1 Tax=Candidatus Iainarchaeum sp. TaxID=3101447 RepID=A0A7J4JFR9_9ARCH|nr:radical SAM protein [Candidatus Diapherotrites archaeon]HIH16603.1 radical SAM protein [Candidatus Diapherotrites archaeon]